MIILYGLILPILSILLLPLILLAFLIQPKFRAGFWQKIGFYKKNISNKDTILIHAVSVGEVNAVEQLVKKMREEFPDKYLILSTVTKTGQEVANNKLNEYTDEIVYFPYDLFFSVSSCLNKLNVALKKQKLISEKDFQNLKKVIKLRNYMNHEFFLKDFSDTLNDYDRHIEKLENCLNLTQFLIYEATDIIDNKIDKLNGDDNSIRPTIFD